MQIKACNGGESSNGLELRGTGCELHDQAFSSPSVLGVQIKGTATKDKRISNALVSP